MKKTIGTLLAVSMCAAMVVGCSKAADSHSASSTNTEPENTAVSEAAADDERAAGAEQFENKKLSIAVFEGGYGPDYWNEIVDRFEAAYPGVEVEMQISPSIGDVIRPQIVAGNVPDFIVMNDNDSTGLIASIIKEKGLMDITDVFEGPGIDDDTPLKDQINEGVLETAKCQPYGDGKIYLAPFNSSPMGLVYNKTLFEEMGYELPTTWDEFFALGDQAKKDGYALMTYAGIYPGYMESFLWPALASAAGLDHVGDISNYVEGSYSTPEVMEILQYIAKIGTDGYLLDGTVALNHTQSQTEMMMNKCLFIPNGNWMENEMAEAPRADGFEFGLWTAPVLKKGDQAYVMTSVEQFSIPANAKNPQLAKEFLRFLYTEDSVKLFAQKANGIYALKDATELSKGLVSDGIYNMNSVYEHGTSMVFGFAALPEGCKVVPRDRVFKVLSDVMTGKMSAQEWAQGVEDSFKEVNSMSAR
ncbi:MAG: carbohydrate ABC transporter substrate-binding protein [Lachnospiraceae bacterium]